MRLKVLSLGPIDDPLRCIPLIDMQARDFLNALTGQHNELQSARIGEMNRRVGAFQPAIELHELFIVEPARALDLGFGRNFRGRIVWVRKPRGDVFR